MNVVKTSKLIDISTNVVFLGLAIFFSGIYMFIDGGDIKRSFYILVMLPMLYIVFFLRKDFFINHYIWLLMLLPIYLILSHFWAPEENIIKSSFFHIKKLIYIFFFIISVFYIFDKKPMFLRFLLQALFVIGAISAIVSIICFLSKECGVVGGRLASFSVQDINKAGAIYTVHMSLSIFFLFYGFFETKKDPYWIKFFLIVGFFVSALATFYAKTQATWIMLIILVFFALVPAWSKKSIGLTFVITIISLSVFIVIDGYSVLLQDGSFTIRLKLIQESIIAVEQNVLFGIGMTHKLPLLNLTHPHNIFIDVYRFGGMVGLLCLLVTCIYLSIKGMWAANNSVLAKFCLAWFISGLAIMSVHAQQPITRPGGYIWFFYWMPLVILAAEIYRVEKRIFYNA